MLQMQDFELPTPLIVLSYLQVPVVQAAFSPSAADVQAAMRLLTAYTEHQRQGQGAFIFEGKMIDAPTVLQVSSRQAAAMC